MIRAMAEEFARRGVDPIGSAAKVDSIEIELEDLVLTEFTLERERENPLLDLAREAPVVGQEDVSGKLLRDRRRGPDAVAFGGGGGERPADADRVDSDMASKAPVLGRNHCGAHFWRNILVG